MSEEIYPMPSFPLLLVSNLEASSRWYQEALGFQHIFTMPGPGGAPMLAHLRWIKYANLLITTPRDGKPVPEPRGLGISLNFNMFGRPDESVDALAEQARAHRANIASGPIDQPWNVRELTVLDPDGYRLVFSAPINIGMNFDEVLKRTAGEK